MTCHFYYLWRRPVLQKFIFRMTSAYNLKKILFSPENTFFPQKYSQVFWRKIITIISHIIVHMYVYVFGGIMDHLIRTKLNSVKVMLNARRYDLWVKIWRAKGGIPFTVTKEDMEWSQYLLRLKIGPNEERYFEQACVQENLRKLSSSLQPSNFPRAEGNFDRIRSWFAPTPNWLWMTYASDNVILAS